MLALKESPLLSRGRRDPATRAASILTLPLEIVTIILEALYSHNATHGRIYNILAASRTCRVLREAAVPLLFDTLSCTIRESSQERPHPSFSRITQHPELLRNVRTLNVRRPLETDDAITVSHAGSQPRPAEQIQAAGTAATTTPLKHDLETIVASIRCMPSLRQIR